MNATAARAARFTISLLLLLTGCTEAAPPGAAPGSLGGGRLPTLAPSAALPTAAECALRVQRNVWEPRPANARANSTVPPGPVWARTWGSPEADALQKRVTGAFTGTTDEIIQWASCKWGFDTEITRAQAAQESKWHQSYQGDGGVSFGLMQIKSTYWIGTAPWSAKSTAYNVDWALGLRRACFEGYVFGERARGDVWGCVGAHFSGQWLDAASRVYIDRVKHQLADRPWLEWPSPVGGRPPSSARPPR